MKYFNFSKKSYPLFFFLFAFTASFGQSPVINGVSTNNSIVKKYALFEITINLTAAYTNPYDYDDISLQAIFISPRGKKDTVDGFFMQNYILDDANWMIKKSGEGTFKIRFTPDKPGVWKYAVSCKNKYGVTAAQTKTFTCIESANPGFIKKNKSNYLSFDNHLQYIPVGENMDTYENNFFTDYKRWMDNLAANDANFITAWMINKGSGIEWTAGKNGFEGLKKYNQANAFQLDWLLDYCAEKNIYVMICLNTAGNVVSTINPPWADNPYNKINGGTCINQGDFFSDAQAKATLKNRLRYIIARYGYSPNIAAWELFNEVDDIDRYKNYKTVVTNWLDEMSRFLKTADVNKHLVTVSYSNENNNDDTWMLPGIDFTQTHQYLTLANIEKAIADIADIYVNKFHKGELTGEFGINAENINLAQIDPNGVYFHNVIWASALSGAMGTAVTYWWHNYIDPQNLYYHFKPLSIFLSSLKLKDEKYQKAAAYTVNAGLTDMQLTPDAGWGTVTADTFKIDAAGNLHPKINQLGIYLFGKALNTQFYKPAIFTINYFADGKFTVVTGSRGTPSPKINIALDGKQLLDKDAAINTAYSIPVPAGKHIIKVDNTGKDWIWVNQYLFTNIVSLLDCYVLKNAAGTKAAGYILNSRYNWKYLSEHAQTPPPAIGRGSSIFISGLQNGNYTVNFFNCASASVISSVNASASNGTLSFSLPAVQWDIAFTAEKMK